MSVILIKSKNVRVEKKLWEFLKEQKASKKFLRNRPKTYGIVRNLTDCGFCWAATTEGPDYWKNLNKAFFDQKTSS